MQKDNLQMKPGEIRIFKDHISEKLERPGCMKGACKHTSDCSVHNGENAGECDCGVDMVSNKVL